MIASMMILIAFMYQTYIQRKENGQKKYNGNTKVTLATDKPADGQYFEKKNYLTLDVMSYSTCTVFFPVYVYIRQIFFISFDVTSLTSLIISTDALLNLNLFIYFIFLYPW